MKGERDPTVQALLLLCLNFWRGHTGAEVLLRKQCVHGENKAVVQEQAHDTRAGPQAILHRKLMLLGRGREKNPSGRSGQRRSQAPLFGLLFSGCLHESLQTRGSAETAGEEDLGRGSGRALGLRRGARRSERESSPASQFSGLSALGWSSSAQIAKHTK